MAIAAIVALSAGCTGQVYGGDDVDPVDGFEAGRDPGSTQHNEFEIPLCPGGLEHPLARDLHLREVALYQTLKVPLYVDGAWSRASEVPVVAGKQALLRVFVDPLERYRPRPVRAVARIRPAVARGAARSDNEGALAQVVDERVVADASTEDAQESTFNIVIPANLMTPDAKIDVTLEEVDCDADAGTLAHARAPRDGSAPLHAEAIGNLRVVLVPMTVDGREPKLDDAQVQRIRAALLAFYPVPRVELAVHVGIAGGADVAPHDRAAWADLLQRVRELRQREQPADDVYYIGLFQPAASRAAYCARGGCILGLAPQVVNPQPSAQYAAAAFFEDTKSGESVVHELGHAHGLGHVACAGAINDDGIDRNYPFRDGIVGDWGWDSRTRALTTPDLHDVMSYCEPYGMSAYHYDKLATRARLVNAAPLQLSTVRGSFRELVLSGEGRTRWGRAANAPAASGDLEPASVRDAHDREVARIELGVLRFSHSDGALLTLPTPGADWATIVWGSTRIALADVLPPHAD